jgi:hypothetical protein
VREVASSNLAVPTIFHLLVPIIWRIFFLTIVATSLLFVGWILFYPKPAPRTQWEALDRMTVLREDGRYDEAVRTLQTWMQNDRRDASRDGLLYQQIAMVYFIKAYKRPEAREDSVHQAALTLTRLSVFIIRNNPKAWELIFSKLEADTHF